MKVRIVCKVMKLMGTKMGDLTKSYQVLYRVEDESGEPLSGKWEQLPKSSEKQVLVVDVPETDPNEKVLEVLLARLKLIREQTDGVGPTYEKTEEALKTLMGMLDVTIVGVETNLAAVQEKKLKELLPL